MKPETESAVVREVGLRDGLQSISRVLPTAKKIEWIRDAYAAGQREIEVGSFVPARLLPQLADTDQLVEFAKTLPGLCVSVLVPNLKGAERAIECGADLMLLPLSASRAHSLANLRKSPDDVVAEIARIRDLRDAKASKCLIEVGISTAFGCTLQGKVESAEVLRLLRAVLDAGVDRVGLAARLHIGIVHHALGEFRRTLELHEAVLSELAAAGRPYELWSSDKRGYRKQPDVRPE